jgi:MerR family transcriptional regulator, thiopeptide resistance regulator
LIGELAILMKTGEPATGEPSRAVAERHRQHMSRWFYPVGTQMHRELAELYVADPRFEATYEEIAEGLASYLRDAVLANAQAQERLLSR